MLAQHSAEPQNGSQTVREKSAQNQGNKKAADKGGVSEGASVSTEPESLNEPSASPSIHAPSSTATISSKAEESKEESLNDNEREAVKGLSADAKNVYQMVRDKLSGVKNKKVSRAASAGAALLARHADIIARKVRATLGTPFTAMDYYRTWFDLQYGKGADGFTQTTAARRLKEDMLAWKQKVDDFLAGKLPLRNNIMMRSPLVFDLIGADSTSTLDIAIDSNVLQKLVDKHHFTRKDLLELPKKIADPLFVLRAIDTKTGVEDTQKRIVVVDMEINGATVMIPFVLNTSKGLNKIASAYGREKASGQPNDQWYIDRLNPKNLLYINKNRTVRWVATRTGAAGSHNAPLTKQSFSTISIADENDLSKLKKENPGFYQRRAELPDAERKEMQFRIIEETNPMHDDIHTGIRSVDDILTAKEAFETKVDEDESYLYPDFTETDGKAALKNGEVTIYSSYPIAPGVFVTPSKMQAQDYAGGGKVYSKKVSVKDVAWIHSDEGQYAPIETESFNQSAWHGSPHDFVEFLLSMIGTGEGAQVHGWGLYFAKLRETANGYKERLKKPGFFYDGKEKKELPTDIQEALDSVFKGRELFIHDNAEAKKRFGQALVEMQKNVDRARESLAEIEEYVRLIKQNPNMSVPELLKKMGAIESVEEVSNEEVSSEELSYNNILKEVEVAKTSSEKELREYQRAYGLLQKIDPEKIETSQRGTLFEVEIPDDDVLLDEQKSLADQHKNVRGLLATIVKEDGGRLLKYLGYEKHNKEYAEIIQKIGRLESLIALGKRSGNGVFVTRFLSTFGYTNEELDIFRSDRAKAVTEKERLIKEYSKSKEELEKRLAGFAEEFFKEENILKNITGEDFYDAVAHAQGSQEKASRYLNIHGIKGITYDGRRDGRCFVVFDDKAISIIEKFNQQMNEIIKGTTQDVHDGQRIVSLFEEADESTFLHEMGHLFLLDLERLADMSPTSAQELQTVRKWATWSEGQTEEYKGTPFAAEFAKLDADIRTALKKGDEKTANKLKRRWEHERFARGFEMYLKHGEAPTKGLRAVFAKFRAFLQRVYQAFTGMGGRATAEVEAVMARMISIEDSSDLSGYPQGKKTAVYTDSGKKIPVQYRVVSADDLIASHDAGALEINPGYPTALQPRDRERVMMRQQVTRMSNTLRPEDLADGRNLNQGAPLIRNDGVVLNGNGRTIAIQRAQARNKERATAYRDYLVENAATFGLSKEEVESVKNPVLVREVQGDISDVQMQDIIGSTTGGARMGASEAAQADAEKITYAMLDAYVPNDKGDLTTAANRNFVAGILHKVVGNGEMNAYLDKDGHVNADGIQRVKRALFACAYGDDELVAKMSESTDDDIRNVSNGMMSAAPMMARLSVKKGVPYVKELQDAIGAAVKQLDALRASGESVKDYLGAQALFAEHEDSAEMRAILSFLDENKRSGKRIATFFSRVATTLDKMETPSGNELFDAEVPSLMDVLDGGRSFAVNGGQDNLFDEYIVKEANALYNEATKKFPDITDKEVADHVREAIQLTLDFGQGNGEIKAVGRGTLGDEKLSSHRDVGHTDDYRSSRSLRKESEKELKRGKIYGLGITRKLVNDGVVSLVGQKAKSAADLAEIAQVLRHHGYEKFHYVYVDDAGNVKFHETVTARLPANAPIFLPEDVHQGNNSGEYLENAKRRIVDNMRRFGASKFYLIHNHPSGDPTPSKEDFDVTSALVDLKNTTLTSSFGGHIVLDHNKYAVIDGDMNSAQHVLKNQYKADYYFPEKAHPALGVNVASEDVTQNIADMYGTEAETTAFYLTAKNVVRSVQKIHDNFKDVDEKTQMNYLRYCARNVGGLRVILVTSNKGLYDSIKDRINSGSDDGILDVVLMKDGRALYPEEKYRANKTPSWLGQEYRSVRVEQVLEKKTHYGSASFAPTVDTLLQSSPALRKSALEYGAKEGGGKVTFTDETRRQEFLKIAKALLSAGERKPSARRQEALKEMLNGIRLIPPTRVSPRKRVLVDWGREMGVPVVFFKGDPSLHGFHQNGVTFLNVDSEITPQWTFWHEAMHWMKANNPDIYSDLVREIRGAEGFTKKQLDAYRKEIGAPNMSDADVIEEMIADTLPDARRRVPLLQDIGKRDTGLIQRVVAWIHDVMRRFHDHFYALKGGLASLQRQAMVRAFGNLARSIRDAEGKPIFRVGYEGARIILHDKSPLPEVKYSLDNGGREGDNEGGRSTSIEARNQAITDSVTSLFRREVDSLKESGLSEQEIARVLGDEHSDLRTRVLAPWLRQYNQFQAKYPDKRGLVNRIEGRGTTDRSLSNEEISRRFDIFKTRMERMMDDAGLVYAECAHQRASRPSFAGFHSWQGVEQSIREHGGSAEFKERPTTGTKTSLNTKHLEQQGAFSMPKFSANTQESRKGNFKWLTGAIRRFVGVAPADNLELPGRPIREHVLSSKELEQRIKERWIQEKNIISQEKQPDGKIKVTYYPDTHDVGYVDWIKSVRQVAKRNPFVKILYDLAHKAMKKQEHLRNEFGKVLKELGELVKNEEDLKTLAKILWLGDAKGKVFTDAELRAEGAGENAIKAYRLVRRELEKAYKMLRDAQTQVKTYAREVAPESVEAFKKNHWIEDEDIISVTPHLNGKLLLT